MTVYVCKQCGYGIAVAKAPLPKCPMCRSDSWKKEGRHA